MTGERTIPFRDNIWALDEPRGYIVINRTAGHDAVLLTAPAILVHEDQSGLMPTKHFGRALIFAFLPGGLCHFAVRLT
jgi:hypothetical protein